MAIGRFVFFIVSLVAITLADMDAPSSVRKCCPVNEALNSSPMFCTAEPKLRDAAYFRFNATTRFGKPDCRDDDVIVEYSSTKTSLTLNGDGHLIVPVYNNLKASVYVPAESFCVDNALPDDALNASHVWSAWVCQPSSECDHMPCVRKCCGPSEYMQVLDGISQCVRHDDKKPFVPLFHHIENSSSFEQYVEVFGVKHHEKCLSYLDDISVGDYFLLGSKTGRLISNFSGTEYDHSEYCVENIDDESHTLKLYFCFEPSDSWWIVLSLWTPMVLVSITLIVHFIVTSTSTMIDRAHFRFLICMVSSYLGLCISSLLTDTHWLICWTLSYFVCYVSLSYYTWLSVVVYEIYRFYRLKFSGSTMKNQFCYYSIFAWGTPLVIMLINRALQNDNIFLYVKNPSNTSCWYHIVPYAYYFVFVGLILLLTLVMCGLIKWNIRKLAREANQQNPDGVYQTQSSKHVKLVIVISLAAFVVMTLNTVVNGHIIDRIFEVGPGVFVFVIFVLNRSTIETIKRKWSQENNGLESSSNSDIGIIMTVNRDTGEQIIS